MVRIFLIFTFICVFNLPAFAGTAEDKAEIYDMRNRTLQRLLKKSRAPVQILNRPKAMLCSPAVALILFCFLRLTAAALSMTTKQARIHLCKWPQGAWHRSWCKGLPPCLCVQNPQGP